MSKYKDLVELQTNADWLSLENSIKITTMIMNKSDKIDVAIFMMKLMDRQLKSMTEEVEC